MNLQQLLNDIQALPQEKQQEVVDYIAFLKSRYGIRKEKKTSTATAEKSGNFFGMWRNRDDMADWRNRRLLFRFPEE